MFDLITQALFSGVLQGGSYALIALGLALVFGAMNIINLAHGELVLLAAYVAYTLESKWGVNPLFAVPAAVPIVCAASAVVYLLLSRVKKNRELNSLILTYGVGIVLTNLVQLIWSADVHSTGSDWLQEGFSIGPIVAMRSEVVFFLVSTVLMAALWWWLSASWYGRAIRAVADNRAAATLMGIDPTLVEIASVLVAGLLASFAGIAIYSYGVIQPSFGSVLTVKAFVITVLAGVGSIPGVLVAALVIGVAEALTVTFVSSSLQDLAGMSLFVVILLVRPNGLFGKGGRRG